MMNDDCEISCDFGSMASQHGHKPTHFMQGILCYRSITQGSYFQYRQNKVMFERNEKLNFNEHFHDLQSRATSRLNVFKLLAKNGVDNRTLVRLYKVYVRPLFEYGSISFLPANTMRLQKIQNEFFWVSLRLPRYLRNDLVHKSAGLSVLKDRLIDLDCQLMRKMSAHEVIKESIQSSIDVIASNHYTSPLDSLKEKLSDLF